MWFKCHQHTHTHTDIQKQSEFCRTFVCECESLICTYKLTEAFAANI